MRQLRFAPPSARVAMDCATADALAAGASEAAAWADGVAAAIERPSGVVVRIGALRRPVDESRRLAHLAADAVCEALRRRGAPAPMRLEIDRPQATEVRDRRIVRTLLPHHDGQHCSYLTPSILDVPEWEPARRTFSDEGFTTTNAHKLYHGIFVAEPGEGLSVTTYVDWVAVVRLAFARAIGHEPASVPELARWLGGNIERSLRWQPSHGCRYLSMGAALGSRDLVQHGVSCHMAEADFSAAEHVRFPALRALREPCACPCGECGGPAERMVCAMLHHTTGLTFPAWRLRFEVAVPSEQGDLVMGHNLRLVHGGLMGGATRLLEPLCMVVDRPEGPDYEAWLAAQWRLPGIDEGNADG